MVTAFFVTCRVSHGVRSPVSGNLKCDTSVGLDRPQNLGIVIVSTRITWVVVRKASIHICGILKPHFVTIISACVTKADFISESNVKRNYEDVASMLMGSVTVSN